MRTSIFAAALMMGLMTKCAMAASLTFKVYKTEPANGGSQIGVVEAEQNRYGVVFKPDIEGLSPGLHGFHVHEYPKCADNGKAAGGHFDPHHTGVHKGPFDDSGHLGDLPALYVNDNGIAKHPVLAPRLELSDLIGHSLIIHKDGDNYSDTPKPLGGGGARVACGLNE